MKSFNQFINEDTKAECMKKFERYLFGEFFGVEDDTKDEAKVWTVIRDYVAGKYMHTTNRKNVVNALKQLHACKKYYSKLLEPPSGYMLRGMNAPASDLKKLNFTLETTFKPGVIKPKLQFYGADYTYSPRSDVQSWTTDEQTALLFWSNSSGRSPNKPRVPGIFEAKINKDETLFDPEFTNKLSAYAVGKEYEIFRFTKKPIKGTLYISEGDYKDFVEDK